MQKTIIDGKSTHENTLSNAARTLSATGSSKGGIASARKLTPAQRKHRARKAVMARWKKKRIKAIDNTKSA